MFDVRDPWKTFLVDGSKPMREIEFIYYLY